MPSEVYPKTYFPLPVGVAQSNPSSAPPAGEPVTAKKRVLPFRLASAYQQEAEKALSSQATVSSPQPVFAELKTTITTPVQSKPEVYAGPQNPLSAQKKEEGQTIHTNMQGTFKVGPIIPKFGPVGDAGKPGAFSQKFSAQGQPPQGMFPVQAPQQPQFPGFINDQAKGGVRGPLDTQQKPDAGLTGKAVFPPGAGKFGQPQKSGPMPANPVGNREPPAAPPAYFLPSQGGLPVEGTHVLKPAVPPPGVATPPVLPFAGPVPQFSDGSSARGFSPNTEVRPQHSVFPPAPVTQQSSAKNPVDPPIHSGGMQKPGPPPFNPKPNAVESPGLPPPKPFEVGPPFPPKEFRQPGLAPSPMVKPGIGPPEAPPQAIPITGIASPGQQPPFVNTANPAKFGVPVTPGLKTGPMFGRVQAGALPVKQPSIPQDTAVCNCCHKQREKGLIYKDVKCEGDCQVCIYCLAKAVDQPRPTCPRCSRLLSSDEMMLIGAYRESLPKQ